MGETLEALHRLQAVERQLAEIRRDREAKVRRVEYHRRQIRKAHEKLEATQASIRERQTRADALQLEMTSFEESIDKHRQALNTAKTNKEYAAILTAMNTEKADSAKLETQILQELDAAQALKNEAAKIEATIVKLTEDATRADTSLQEHDKKWKNQRDGLQADRDVCAEKVPPAALAVFNRVAEHHDGEALVPVSRLHPKREEYICSGCNMKVTLEVINALHTRDDIQECAVCGRILHLDSTPSAQRSRT
jgi:predicted  nucleic acid-binding Zn-ribbon protein